MQVLDTPEITSLKDSMESEPTSTIASQPLSALPFTTRLQEFHRALSNIDWERDMPGCLFIRDYENLPTSASFDIDMMADEGVWKTLEAVFSSIAEQNELICMSRTSPSGLFILLFDVHKEADRRGWAYYEVRKELPFIKGEGISAREIEISCESGLPLPSKQWQFLLFLHQGLRKGKVAKYRTEIGRAHV